MKNRRNVQPTALNQASLALITTELEVGHTFASIALETEDEIKRARNRGNARKAYDTALRFLGDTTLTRTQAARIKDGFQQLKRDLEQLGENGLGDGARKRLRRLAAPGVSVR